MLKSQLKNQFELTKISIVIVMAVVRYDNTISLKSKKLIFEYIVLGIDQNKSQKQEIFLDTRTRVTDPVPELSNSFQISSPTECPREIMHVYPRNPLGRLCYICGMAKKYDEH